MFFTFHNTVELLGIIAFAFSGALAAMQKKLDVFGILVLTFVTAIGGGTLRDMMIGSLPVSWMKDLETIITLIVCYLIALFFTKYIRRFHHTMFWLDTIGLAFFCVVAIAKAITFGLHPIVAVAIGTISGCFGGIIRDVLLNEIPYVFRKDVYASACIAGGVAYFGLLQFIPDENLVSIIAGCVIIVIRVSARYFNLHMPDVYRRS
ncbi:MAG: trimeric intracellular cation channel family protein [Bacteroidia bacterium]